MSEKLILKLQSLKNKTVMQTAIITMVKTKTIIKIIIK
jgi:hypothetical protein